MAHVIKSKCELHEIILQVATLNDTFFFFFLFLFLSCNHETGDLANNVQIKGQNGQIPSILEIFCPETLFWKNIVIYHFLWYSSLLSSSTIFFNPTWPNDMESSIKQIKNKKFGHLVLELGGLEYCP